MVDTSDIAPPAVARIGAEGTVLTGIEAGAAPMVKVIDAGLAVVAPPLGMLNVAGDDPANRLVQRVSSANARVSCC